MSTLLQPVSTAFVAICKKSYVAAVNDNDELLISNWGALRLGLQAMLSEDANDFVRAGQLWGEAKRLLIAEEENRVGAGAQGSIQMADDFEMECFPIGL
jgi:hypothetical protein